MKMVREIQEAKRTIISVQEEVATEKRNLEWIFGNGYIYQLL